MGSYLSALDHPGDPGVLPDDGRDTGHCTSALRLVTIENTSRINQPGFRGI
ncbi:MAG: hypothetical protein ACRDRP_04035 [Pseudonocardiaceae bacterium]